MIFRYVTIDIFILFVTYSETSFTLTTGKLSRLLVYLGSCNFSWHEIDRELTERTERFP